MHYISNAGALSSMLASVAGHCRLRQWLGLAVDMGKTQITRSNHWQNVELVTTPTDPATM